MWTVWAAFMMLAVSASAQQLSLHDAIEQAQSGPAAQATAAQVEEARGGVRQAGLGINPRLFLQSEDFRPWDSNYSFTTQTEDYGYVSQTFELDGKRHKRVSSATAQLHQAESDAVLARQQIAGRVAAAYWNAVVSEQQVVLLRQDMTAVDEMVTYHRERVKAGAMRGVDLLRMEIERNRLRIALNSAERDAETARLELFKQIGHAPIPSVKLIDQIDQSLPVEPVPISVVLQQRADILAARDALTAAEADVKLQQAKGVPDLDLLGGYKRNSTDNTGYAALQIPLPFRNRNQGEVERAKASADLARARLRLLEIQAQADVSESEENYRRSKEVVETVLPELRSQARENLQIMTEAYRIGGVDLLRFVDAERTEFDVEINALHTYAELQQATLRLKLSYGIQP